MRCINQFVREHCHSNHRSVAGRNLFDPTFFHVPFCRDLISEAASFPSPCFLIIVPLSTLVELRVSILLQRPNSLVRYPRGQNAGPEGRNAVSW
jgi:hypothetical protein